ncbi:MAG TPA: type II toxin-antitoxin system RelE/ParE family toxin [Desulfobacterales bacterium]|nr:type II toxin-antitoxin system RelE/ParE family toxin [Desulfobacterales bacterium]HPN87693.1 type II toxin-antitoxin system RelE/ParE family toxin [Smithella sp.]HQP26027.1 type II toxin-antitoxin system RelE/ParE family toxin [Smithellaceae bacterium]
MIKKTIENQDVLLKNLDIVPLVVHIKAMKRQGLITVSFYKSNSGKEPVREWLLEEVTTDERKIIGRDIKIVQMSWPMGMPLVESFGGGLWQVRSMLSSKISRVFFTFFNNEIILLHGFIKKTKKTPVKDLELAKSRKDSFRKG